MAMPFYALTTEKRTNHTEKHLLMAQLQHGKTMIQPARTSSPALNIKPPPGFFDQIPITLTTLLAPTFSQITAVSNIEA